ERRRRNSRTTGSCVVASHAQCRGIFAGPADIWKRSVGRRHSVLRHVAVAILVALGAAAPIAVQGTGNCSWDVVFGCPNVGSSLGGGGATLVGTGGGGGNS